MSRVRSICLFFAVFSAASTLCGCEAPVELRVADLELKFTSALSCRPSDSVDRVIVEALGDFPAGRTIEILRPSDEPGTIDRFPEDTAALVVTASSPRWQGAGIRYAGAGETRGAVLLVPDDRACGLADPALAYVEAAAVPLKDGSLFLAGGMREGLAIRRVVLLPPGETFARTADDLSVPRLRTAAAEVGERVVVVGGALGETGPAHDTFEVFSAEGGQLSFGTLAGPRRDASVVALDETRVLIVGGRETAEGDALTRVEILDVESEISTVVAPLPFGRSEISLVRMDDGAILAIGGVASNGNPVGDVFAYNVDDDSWQTIEEVRLPGLRMGATALAGSRVVVWANSEPGRSSAVMRILRRVPPFLSATPALEYDDVDFGFAPLDQVAAARLPDGRLLFTGEDAEGVARAFTLDTGRAITEELFTMESPSRLSVLADGLVVEQGTSGASVRRPVVRTFLHQPPATLLPEDFALDAPERWTEMPAALHARVGDARADLAAYRFANFALELGATGVIEILLRREGALPIAIKIEPDRFGPLPARCQLERIGTERLRLERHGNELRVSQGEREQRCTIEGLEGRVGIGVLAQAGATVEAPALQRL